jgi:hypothetical protein
MERAISKLIMRPIYARGVNLPESGLMGANYAFLQAQIPRNAGNARGRRMGLLGNRQRSTTPRLTPIRSLILYKYRL